MLHRDFSRVDSSDYLWPWTTEIHDATIWISNVSYVLRELVLSSQYCEEVVEYLRYSARPFEVSPMSCPSLPPSFDSQPWVWTTLIHSTLPPLCTISPQTPKQSRQPTLEWTSQTLIHSKPFFFLHSLIRGICDSNGDLTSHMASGFGDNLTNIFTKPNRERLGDPEQEWDFLKITQNLH